MRRPFHPAAVSGRERARDQPRRSGFAERRREREKVDPKEEGREAVLSPLTISTETERGSARMHGQIEREREELAHAGRCHERWVIRPVEGRCDESDTEEGRT